MRYCCRPSRHLDCMGYVSRHIASEVAVSIESSIGWEELGANLTAGIGEIHASRWDRPLADHAMLGRGAESPEALASFPGQRARSLLSVAHGSLLSRDELVAPRPECRVGASDGPRLGGRGMLHILDASEVAERTLAFHVGSAAGVLGPGAQLTRIGWDIVVVPPPRPPTRADSRLGSRGRARQPRAGTPHTHSRVRLAAQARSRERPICPVSLSSPQRPGPAPLRGPHRGGCGPLRFVRSCAPQCFCLERSAALHCPRKAAPSSLLSRVGATNPLFPCCHLVALALDNYERLSLGGLVRSWGNYPDLSLGRQLEDCWPSVGPQMVFRPRRPPNMALKWSFGVAGSNFKKTGPDTRHRFKPFVLKPFRPSHPPQHGPDIPPLPPMTKVPEASHEKPGPSGPTGAFRARHPHIWPSNGRLRPPGRIPRKSAPGDIMAQTLRPFSEACDARARRGAGASRQSPHGSHSCW